MTSLVELHLFDLESDTSRAHASDVADDARVRLHLGDSSTHLAALPNNSFDWIYVDGDHSEAVIRRDPDCAAQKIVECGLLVFNDCTIWSQLELTDYGTVLVVNSCWRG